MKKKIQQETRYEGYFLMDSGLKVSFDISEDEGGEAFSKMYDSQFPYEKGDSIWLGECDDCFILVDRIIGFNINQYQSDIS